jgi:hypothetical protein
MINYSSYIDAWGLSQDILKKNIIDSTNKKEYNKDEIKMNESYCKLTKCDNMNHILNCDSCLKKLKDVLNVKDTYKDKSNETFSNNFSNNFSNKISNNLKILNYKINNILLTLCDNYFKKMLILFLLVLLFIISSFQSIKGDGISSGDDSNIEAVSQAVTGSSNDLISVNMKYIKENFVLIPKNLVNITPNL